jgi:GNAT superfamily N-acetyltransferase
MLRELTALYHQATAVVPHCYPVSQADLGAALAGQGSERSASAQQIRAARDQGRLIGWLGIQEPYQGIGLGKHLLQRGLNEMRGVGYRHASISTAWDNYRAYVLYTHFGFKVVDWTYQYVQGSGD